jgi:hypothetical protein
LKKQDNIDAVNTGLEKKPCPVNEGGMDPLQYTLTFRRNT